jgi:hypothetical protein
VVEPLTPELALVDPELARRARDRLPTPGEPLSPPTRTPSSDKAVSAVDDHPWLESSPSATPSVAAEVQPGPAAAMSDRELPALRRARPRRRVFLAAFGVVVAMAAIYAFAPASTVRDEFPSRVQQPAPTRIDRQATAQAPANHPKRSAGVRAATASRHSTLPTAATHARAKSSQRSSSTTRLFIWPAVPRATFYKVEFLRGGRRVFEALASTPRLELPRRWGFEGHTYRLVPGGRYSWRVSPAFGPRSHLRYGNPIVRSTWVARP